jgi:NAD(P)-dependent dehydrogenase (short-subunit alcohol dehydrogenase family)
VHSGVSHRFGRVGVLLNNTGVLQKTPIQEIELDGWEQIMAVNLRGEGACQATRYD